jgi:hypothetical protein
MIDVILYYKVQRNNQHKRITLILKSIKMYKEQYKT